MSTDKLPPQALDLEETVLGAMLIEAEAVDVVLGIIPEADVFYDQKHKIVYQAIEQMTRNRERVDIVTLTMHLKARHSLEAIGGAYYISQLTNRVGSALNAEPHARILVQKWMQRKCTNLFGKAYGQAYEETTDVFELIDRINTETMGLLNTVTKRGQKAEQHVAEITKQCTEHYYMRAAMSKTGEIIGVDTGLRELNRITNGWQSPNLIILAARPAMGKTALMLKFAKSAAQSGKPVAIFSLEMSSQELVNRMIVEQAELNSERFKSGSLGNGEVQGMVAATEFINQLPIHIDDVPGKKVLDFQRDCRRMKKEHDIQLIIVDYLQLMSATEGDKRGGNREQEISTISRTLKATAKELDVPVIALSQLSREVEKTADKRPTLAHLRESGAIEQDADAVVFIHRPEYYNITTDEDGNQLEPGLTELIIAKHRNGGIGKVNVRFIDRLTKFTDLHGHVEPINYNPQSGITPNTSFNDEDEEPF